LDQRLKEKRLRSLWILWSLFRGERRNKQLDESRGISRRLWDRSGEQVVGDVAAIEKHKEKRENQKQGKDSTSRKKKKKRRRRERCRQVLDSPHVVEAVWNGALESVEVEITAIQRKRQSDHRLIESQKGEGKRLTDSQSDGVK